MINFNAPLLPALLIVLSSSAAFAQDTTSNYHALPHDTVRTTANIPKNELDTMQTDLYTVVSNWFHSKGKKRLPSEKPITSKPSISVVPAVGYTLTTGFAATLSGNAAFRTSPQARISTISASVGFTQKNQFTVPIVSNIWSAHSDWVYIGDTRYYKYPLNTYGLGSNSHARDIDTMRFNLFRFYEMVMRKIGKNFYLGLGYALDDHNHIEEKGNKYGTETDYQLYAPVSSTVSSAVTFNLMYDSRDNAINAYHGFYTFIQYRDNYKFLGSTSPYRSVYIDMRKYFNLPYGSRNVLALWTYDWFILSGKPPYLDLPSTGWDAYSCTGRGYVQGRFRGAQMVYFEGEYRFNLTRNGLLGGVVFANAQSLSAQPGTQLERVRPAFGPGLRAMINKKSRTHIAIDYGIGQEGSRGLFVNVGEVF